MIDCLIMGDEVAHQFGDILIQSGNYKKIAAQVE